MKIEVDLPLQSRHVAQFTPETLQQLVEALPGTPVVLNVAGSGPDEKLGVVESAWVVDDRARAKLDVTVPPALLPLVEDGSLGYGINARAKRRVIDGEYQIEEFLGLNSVDLVRPPHPPR